MAMELERRLKVEDTYQKIQEDLRKAYEEKIDTIGKLEESSGEIERLHGDKRSLIALVETLEKEIASLRRRTTGIEEQVELETAHASAPPNPPPLAPTSVEELVEELIASPVVESATRQLAITVSNEGEIQVFSHCTLYFLSFNKLSLA